jgi:uncharacterized membrane protein
MKDLSLQLKKLLKLNQIQLDWDEFQFQFTSHPSYPSLHAATGVLDHFNVINIAARVPVDKDTLEHLPESCIIQINKHDQLKLAILRKDKKGYSLIQEDSSKERVTSEKILELFTGIVLAIEKDEKTLEKTTKDNLNLLSSGIIALLSLFAMLFLSRFSLDVMFYTILSLAGIFLSMSILKQELGESNFIGNAFCSNNSIKKSCDAIINSKGALIFGKIKLSHLSLIFFTGFMLSILFLNLQNLSLNGLTLISILSFPITIYSLYYQKFIAKAWCGLCLGIVSVLWLLILTPFFSHSFQFNFDVNYIEILTLIAGFSFSFIFFSVFIPKYKSFKELHVEKINYYRFKKNFRIFSSLLINQNPIDTQINNVDEITLGNPNSALELLVVTNPFCGHCRKVHTLVEDLLHKYQDNLKIVIRFNVNLSQSESDIVNLCAHLQNINNTEPDKMILALDDAYNNLNYKEWIKKWGVTSINVSKYLELFTNQKEWCKANNINFTPYLAINGYAYPKEYDREDLRFFIEDLIEDSAKLFKKQDLLQTAV